MTQKTSDGAKWAGVLVALLALCATILIQAKPLVGLDERVAKNEAAIKLLQDQATQTREEILLKLATIESDLKYIRQELTRNHP